jgi:hypothetical protein
MACNPFRAKGTIRFPTRPEGPLSEFRAKRQGRGWAGLRKGLAALDPRRDADAAAFTLAENYETAIIAVC